MREVLKETGGRPQCPLVLLIGNPKASAMDARKINGDYDYNRIWSANSDSGIGKKFWQLREKLAGRKVRLAIDIHNNNAPNPCHAIYMARDGDIDSLAWAASFAGIVVRSNLSLNTCMEAFATVCPTVTLECGLPGQQSGIDLATVFVKRALMGNKPAANGDAIVYDLVARIMLNPGVSLGFGTEDADLNLPVEAPSMWNFNRIAKGTKIGSLRSLTDDPLGIISQLDRKIKDYFVIEDGKLLAAEDFVPAMLRLKAGHSRAGLLLLCVGEGLPR